VATGCGIATTSSSLRNRSAESDPDVLQREKERNLKGQAHTIHPDTPGWNHRLASDSEAVVKAEKMGDMPMEELQRHTVRIVEELHSTVDVHATSDAGPIDVGSSGSVGNAALGDMEAQKGGPQQSAGYPGSTSSAAS
jgi:hypothetical protein